MTKGGGGATEMFEMLAVLHLHAPPSPGQRGEPTAQIGQVLSGLQRMCKEEWSDFLRFAELQRVYLRTLQLLEKWAVADAVGPRFDGLQDLAQVEQRQVEGALAALHKIVRALELTGHTPLVIKTLDHWPDIGSDLDLFIAATERDTVRAMQSELQAEPQPQSWGDRLAHKWNFRIPGLPRLVEIHVGCLGQTGEQDDATCPLRRNQRDARRRSFSLSRPGSRGTGHARDTAKDVSPFLHSFYRPAESYGAGAGRPSGFHAAAHVHRSAGRSGRE